jgi:hypothetical protein
MKQTLARRSFARLEKMTDPDNDCKMTKDEAAHKLSIAIDPKLHTLSPKIQRKKQPIHNAPMVLTELEGDFLVGVTVTGTMDPGLDPPNDPRGRKLPFCHQAAGLIIYQDKDNFVRLERACRSEGASLARELLVEVVRNGQVLDYYYITLRGDPSSPIDLLVLRHQGRLRCLFSPDGKQLIGFRELALDYPHKVQVGLTASNISKKPFTAQFEDFIVLTDTEKLDEEFGL